MKSFSRRTFLQAAGVSAAAVGFGGVLSACASDSGSGSSDKGATSKSEGHASQVTVSMPVSSEPAAGFDPFVSWGCGEHVHEPLIQSTLLTTTADMGFENDLATAYSCSDDGLTWTFTIRADAKFTNGKALTAHDVAYTINGVANSEASECDLTMVDKAVAVNDETCEIHLNKPFNAFLYTLAVIGIVPDGGHGSDYGTNPIGSGRYMLEQWDHGQQVILKANPDYYGDAPKIDRVVVVFMEEDASLAAARSGQVDVAYTVATYADQQPAGYDLLNCASVDSRGISLPTIAAGATKKQTGEEYPAGNDVTQDLAVRRAINYGVNRQTLIDNVLNGYGEVAYSVSDNMPWSSDDMRCEQDISRAKALLDEAGWVAGADGVRAKDVRFVLLGVRLGAPGHRHGVCQPDGRAWHQGVAEGCKLGRHLPTPVQRPRRVGLGLEQPDRDLQPELLDGQWQLRVLRERGGGRASERRAGQPCDCRFVRRVEACHVGRRERRGPARRCHMGVVRQR